MDHVTRDPSTLYADKAGETEKLGPKRSYAEKRDQAQAIRALSAAWPTVVYAVQFPDSTIKIGCTSDLASRHRYYRPMGGEVVGFMPGDFDAEQAIHESLRTAVARSREWYHPTPEVFAVVNAMRDGFGLPHLAA